MSKKKIIVIYSMIVVFLFGYLSIYLINDIVNNTNINPIKREFAK